MHKAKYSIGDWKIVGGRGGGGGEEKRKRKKKKTGFHSLILQLKLAILFSELKGEIFGNGKRQE